MCIPITIPDMDLTTSAMDEAELQAWAQGYVSRIMDEAWHMDCYAVAATSNGTSTEYQLCAIRALRDKFGDGLHLLAPPDIRATGHASGKRIGRFKGGMF